MSIRVGYLNNIWKTNLFYSRLYFEFQTYSPLFVVKYFGTYLMDTNITRTLGQFLVFGLLSIAVSSCYKDPDNKVEPIASPTIPTVTTNEISEISFYTAKSGGVITSDGGSKIKYFGICWSRTPNPVVELRTKTNYDTGSTSFKQNIKVDKDSTIYYVRAYAVNSFGVGYGEQRVFRTKPEDATDPEGNVYRSVVIGGKTWLRDNIKATKYRDGSPIITGLDATAWSASVTGAYANYDNATGNSAAYGRLYNFYAVADPRGLCPADWHVATDSEWSNLENAVGGGSIAGYALKSVSAWDTLAVAAKDPFQFSAVGAGFVSSTGNQFQGLRNVSRFWTSSEVDAFGSWSRVIERTNNISLKNNSVKTDGYSVRCVWDGDN